MTFDDLLFNWLSIKITADKRPDDTAAKDTFLFFDSLLREDHGVDAIELSQGESHYVISCQIKGASYEKRFLNEVIETLWKSIEAEPKYNF